MTKIDDYTFNGCCGLTNITIPDSVTEIGSWSFGGCFALTSINIPKGVTNISDYAFFGCYGLTAITVADGNPVYHGAGNCLIKASEKTLIVGCKASVIPNDGSVIKIGDSAFGNCKGLTSIVIPEGVVEIDDYAFTGCRDLTSVTIPESMKKIDANAFEDCFALSDIYYAGSESEWWYERYFDYYTPENVTLHCKG